LAKIDKILLKVLGAKSDSNIDFVDIVNLLIYLNFNERIKGSHHVFSKDGIPEIINIQSIDNNKSKAYQVKQIRNIILKYKLGAIDNE
jgi:hypothetical protein